MNVKRKLYEGVAVSTALYWVEFVKKIQCNGDEEYVLINVCGPREE